MLQKRPVVPAIPITDEDIEASVGLDQFAAISGTDANSFYLKMIDLIEKGNLLQLLKPQACRDVMVWALNTLAETDSNELMLVFRLSLNKPEDFGLFCVFSANVDELAAKILFDSSFPLPKFKVRHAIPGLMNSPPKEADMNGFEINFCDMETNT